MIPREAGYLGYDELAIGRVALEVADEDHQGEVAAIGCGNDAHIVDGAVQAIGIDARGARLVGNEGGFGQQPPDAVGTGRAIGHHVVEEGGAGLADHLARVPLLQQLCHGDRRAPVVVRQVPVLSHFGFGGGYGHVFDAQAVYVPVDGLGATSLPEEDVAGVVVAEADGVGQELLYAEAEEALVGVVFEHGAPGKGIEGGGGYVHGVGEPEAAFIGHVEYGQGQGELVGALHRVVVCVAYGEGVVGLEVEEGDAYGALSGIGDGVEGSAEAAEGGRLCPCGCRAQQGQGYGKDVTH